jgi:hypothetical protein
MDFRNCLQPDSGLLKENNSGKTQKRAEKNQKNMFYSSIIFFVVKFLTVTKDKETLSPLPYANIILLNKNDLSFITSAVTGKNGFFSINTDDANVLLRVSFLGYNSFSSQITSEDVGTIYLIL